MLSSIQVAQIMQQQQQMFLSSAQYSQMMSQQVYGQGPYGQGGMGGLAAHGGPPPSASFPHIPMQANQQAGFRYGMSYGQGYGPGNDIASRMMATGGGMASAGLGIASIGAGFIPGLGLAAGMGVGGAASIGAMAGKHVIGSMVTGAQEQSNVERVMSQMQFQNAGSRTGRGFGRQDAQMIGDSLRSMQAVPEMLTSMGELTRIMDKVIQTGMMQGVRDPQEFQRKFKSTIGTLKDVARIMNTTMEEAMPLLQEARQSGFYSNAAIRQHAVQRQVVGAVTGMNQAQVSQTAAYGAQIGFQTGGSRATGARHSMRAAAQVGMANQMGMLSNEEIVELTGKEGAEGIQEMAANFTNMAYRMRNSNVGTVMTVGLAETRGGKFTGKMDQDLIKRLRSGNLKFNDLMRMTHEKIASRSAKISYVAHKQRLHSEMAGEAGIEGMAMMLHGILGDRGYDDEDVKNIVTQRFGMSEREAEQVQHMVKRLPYLNVQREASNRQEERRIARQTRLSETMSLEAIKRKITKNIENVVTEPFKEMGVAIRSGIQQRVDDFIDEITGNYKTELTQMAGNLSSGVRSGDARAKGLAGGLSGFAKTGGGFGGHSLAATSGTGVLSMDSAAFAPHRALISGVNWLAGREAPGERYARDIRARSGTRDLTVGGEGKAGDVLLDQSLLGTKTFMSKAGAERATADLRSIESGEMGEKMMRTMEARAERDLERQKTTNAGAFGKKNNDNVMSVALSHLYEMSDTTAFRESTDKIGYARKELEKRMGARRMEDLFGGGYGENTATRQEDQIRALIGGTAKGYFKGGAAGKEGRSLAGLFGLGTTDYRKALGGEEGDSDQLIGARIKAHEKELEGSAVFSGKGTKQGEYSSFRSATKAGEDYMMAMLGGATGKEGALGTGKARTYQDLSASEQKLIDTLEKADRVGAWSDEEHALLKQAGIKDPSSLLKDREKAKQVSEHARVMRNIDNKGLTHLGGILGGEYQLGMRATQAQLADQKREEREALKGGAWGDVSKLAARKGGPEGDQQAKAQKIKELYERYLETGDTTLLGEAAAGLTSLDQKSPLVRELRSSAPSRMTGAAGIIDAATKGLDADKIKRTKGGIKLGDAFKGGATHHLEQLGLDKDQVVTSMDEAKKLIAQQAGKYADIRTGKGTGQESRFASEVEVASDLKKYLAENTATLTSIKMAVNNIVVKQGGGSSGK